MQNKSKSGCRGSIMIEFAFVLIPLMAIIFGGIEMDRMLLAYTSLGNAARAGVRYAIVHGQYADGAVTSATRDNIAQQVKTFARLGMIDSSSMAITPNCTNGTGAYITVCHQDLTGKVGTRVSVRVSHPYTPFTTFFPFSLTLSSTAAGTIAF